MIPERCTVAATAAPAGDESNAEDKFNNLPDEKFSSTFTLLLHFRYDMSLLLNKLSKITFYLWDGQRGHRRC